MAFRSLCKDQQKVRGEWCKQFCILRQHRRIGRKSAIRLFHHDSAISQEKERAVGAQQNHLPVRQFLLQLISGSELLTQVAPRIEKPLQGRRVAHDAFDDALAVPRREWLIGPLVHVLRDLARGDERQQVVFHVLAQLAERLRASQLMRQETDQRRLIVPLQWPAARAYGLEGCATRTFDLDSQEPLDLLAVFPLLRHGIAVELADHRGVHD
ncbi:hypothetical protein AMK17_35770 [Streptomyces sp. CB00072]|nr:hypothetical protein AMK17_35770 [Streptomyces sp. CB00072]